MVSLLVPLSTDERRKLKIQNLRMITTGKTRLLWEDMPKTKRSSPITGGFAMVILKQTIFQVKIATEEKSTEEEHSLKELKSCLVFWCLQEEVKR